MTTDWRRCGPSNVAPPPYCAPAVGSAPSTQTFKVSLLQRFLRRLAAGIRCEIIKTWQVAQDLSPRDWHDKPVSQRFDVTDPEQEEGALAAAANAAREGELLVLPTDTVYGIGADAFSPEAVARLLAAKGRGREMPPPVLVSSPITLEALGDQMPAWVLELTKEFWPGPLTVVVHQQNSLHWDLGDTMGTVAVRMPDHEFTLALLSRVGPMAVFVTQVG